MSVSAPLESGVSRRPPTPAGSDATSRPDDAWNPARGMCDEEPSALERWSALDSRVVRGKLHNGIQYFVRRNAKPQARAELRVALRAGSICEEEEERGIAHMVEHLAFRASRSSSTRFQVLKALEKMGVKFGCGQNAFTSYNQTVYELHVPCDDEALLRQSLELLRELAYNIRCSDTDVDAERQIVVEEWRQSRGSGSRAQEAYLEDLFAGSLYATRLPIGKMDIVRGIAPEKVRAFHAKWYRPSLTAVVAVGDFANLDDVVGLVREVFDVVQGDETDASVAARPPVPIIPAQPVSPVVQVFSDPELTSFSFSMDCKHAQPMVRTADDYRELVVIEIAVAAANARLHKVAMAPDPPFASATLSVAGLVRKYVTSSLVVEGLLEEGADMRAIAGALTELERIKVHGFLEDEITAMKDNLMSDLRMQYIEREQVDSAEHANEYVEYFVSEGEEAAPSIEARVFHTKRLLPTIAPADCQHHLSRFDWRNNCVAQLLLPEPSLSSRVNSWLRTLGRQSLVGATSTESAAQKVHNVISAVERAAAAGDIGPWQHAMARRGLLSPTELGPPGTVVAESRRRFDDLDFVELTLSNGMRVAIKTTDFLQDEVTVTGFATGGLTQLLSPGQGRGAQLLPSARMARTMAEELGLCGIPPDIMAEMCAGTRATVSANVEPYRRHISGEASPTDLNTLLEMVHLLFTTTLEADEARLATTFKLVREHIEEEWRDPHSVFSRRVDEMNNSHHPFFRPLSAADVRNMDAKWACNYYTECFRNPAAFTLVFVGNVTEEKLRPLLETHLASIPTRGPPPLLRQDVQRLRVNFPSSPKRLHLEMPMVEAACSVQVTVPVILGAETATLEERLHDSVMLEHLVHLLEAHLVDRLRFAMGQIYSVNVWTSFANSAPVNGRGEGCMTGTCNIWFGCEPNRAAELSEVVRDEVRAVRCVEMAEDQITGEQHAQRRQHEENLQQNSYWASTIYLAYTSPRFSGDAQATHLEYDQARSSILESLSPQKVRGAFNKIFVDDGTFTVASLVPLHPSRVRARALVTVASVALLAFKCLRR